MQSLPGASDPVTGIPSRIRDGEEGWQARLHLGFVRCGARSVLAGRNHEGPLVVQKALYPEGPQTCHVHMIHPPGGVVGGDRLDISVATGDQSHALITTPAAGKFYRSAGPVARQWVHLDLHRRSALEWLPQESIVYDQACVETGLRVDLGDHSRFVGWELICLGLPASAKPFRDGRVLQRLEIHREGLPLLVETLRIRGRDPVLSASWGLRGYPVSGVLAATVEDPQAADRVRQGIGESNASSFAATCIQGLLVCRFLGNRVADGLSCFRGVWKMIRPLVLGRPACEPRIWNT
ncbi:MAG: urease accessory protein UreD [Thermodesulfobacteriota bacterium]